MTGDLKYINKSLEKSFKILEILSKSIFPQKAATISHKHQCLEQRLFDFCLF